MLGGNINQKPKNTVKHVQINYNSPFFAEMKPIMSAASVRRYKQLSLPSFHIDINIMKIIKQKQVQYLLEPSEVDLKSDQALAEFLMRVADFPSELKKESRKVLIKQIAKS
mmetsp:Transcript_10193/g.7635  ORF Transcript_10193/g.7635 Transcript_10193/m.7635 type:complete len:111 (-) Transcript_10193:729-1061(-)